MTAPLPPLLLVLGMAVATWSVVQYRLPIVTVYVVLALLLARNLTRTSPSDRSPLTAPVAGAALLLVALVTVTVRPYTYLQRDDAWAVRGGLAITALLAAAAFLLPLFAARRGAAPAIARHAPDAALAVAVLGYVAAAVALIHLDPAPKIDVWVTLQQAADAIARGDNIYAQQWTGSPGVQDAFTYLPWTAATLAPGRWLAGDVRWALVVVTLLGVLAVRALASRDAGPRRTVAVTATGALLLLLPGTPTQVEQAWTEPLLFACLAGWALGVARGRTWLAVACLGLGLASKQHLVLLLPVLAAWPGFGPRRTIAAAGVGGVLVLPFFLASPADMWHDTVSMLVSFQPLVFADTLYIAAINELAWTPPFWLTGAAVLGTVGTAAVLVRRRRPDLSTVLQWCALVLFVANLVNKQAFYNQYWLVAALVLLSWAVPAGVAPGRELPERESARTGRPEPSPAVP